MFTEIVELFKFVRFRRYHNSWGEVFTPSPHVKVGLKINRESICDRMLRAYTLHCLGRELRYNLEAFPTAV